MSFSIRAFVLTALTALAMSAHAQTTGAPANAGFHPVIGMDLTWGGEELMTVQYTDGSSTSLRSGGVLQVGGGFSWQSAEAPVSAQMTVNYHYDMANASNGSATFRRFPIEGLVFYTGTPNWRFGGGVRYVMSPRLSGGFSGVGGAAVNFKNTWGAVAEVGYQASPNLWLSGRYVYEKYELDSSLSDKKIDGWHLGIGAQYEFH